MTSTNEKSKAKIQSNQSNLGGHVMRTAVLYPLTAEMSFFTYKQAKASCNEQEKRFWDDHATIVLSSFIIPPFTHSIFV